ncbi:MAG: hypothetical protein IKP75_08620 [Oscillospiraceae bacterium]|nr:hypothetical protein [Oscillospiraceae bacterium]
MGKVKASAEDISSHRPQVLLLGNGILLCGSEKKQKWADTIKKLSDDTIL